MTYILHAGDCLKVMAEMEAEAVDAVVTDPPYGLQFLGNGWDHSVPGEHFWQETLRILRPSCYLLAFGGTRTWHRLACAIEDAGFEVRDTLMWLYGQGFPKSNACLKPAWEPVLLARSPGPLRKLDIDGCRIPVESQRALHVRADTGCKQGYSGMGGSRRIPGGTMTGRWPANVVLDEEAAAALDAESGKLMTHPGVCRSDYAPGMYGAARQSGDVLSVGDSGGASRFFYCAKDRHSRRGDDNPHPTVKPLSLMRWLIRLLKADTILDPFMGSGTTGVACVEEGRSFIGIELNPEYVDLARRRIEAASAQQRFDYSRSGS